jgi:probable 2-oxoglutarate dehydrogenase E1 component DHKTD1
LDLIHRESEVAALNPRRYGLADDQMKYNVNGIVWTKPVNTPEEDTEEWWTLGQVTEHLRTGKRQRSWLSEADDPASLRRSDCV